MASVNTEITPSSPPPYHHSPLPQGHIRLLRLIPHQDKHAPIQCRLFDYPLHDSAVGTHRYEALSYVWGSPEKPHSIILDKGNLSVTTNLYAALLHLRDRFLERMIWIDAICINQNDLEERGSQVQLMAKIYAKAKCVIVWLESPTTGIHHEKTSDEGGRALEVIRRAAETGRRQSTSDEEAVLALLGRLWFRRVWEVAAARHVLMTCYSTEIDGDAFAFGLSVLKDITYDPDIQNHISSIVYLIKYVHLRPKRAVGSSDVFSLDIRPLAELATMYKDCEATDRRDKVYALLNMGSDNNAETSLLPDYSLPWKDVFCRLIRFYVGKQACVQTWNDEDIAVIRGKGCVLGVVSTKTSNNMWDDAHMSYCSIQMTAIQLQEGQDPFQATWYFPDLPPLTKEGDIVCLLQGASEPTIIRAYDDYCAVVAIGFSPKRAAQPSKPSCPMRWTELNNWHDLLKSVTVYPRDFLLVWDRQKPWRDREDSNWLEDNRIPKHAKKQLNGQFSELDRLQDLGPILLDSHKFEQAVYLDMRRKQEIRKTESVLAAADGLFGMGTWLGSVVEVLQTLKSSLSRAGRCIAENWWRVFSILGLVMFKTTLCKG